MGPDEVEPAVLVLGSLQGEHAGRPVSSGSRAWLPTPASRHL